MNYVRDCPTDAVSWNKAAERMDCQSIKQNCSGLNPQQHVFQYHCVVNGWMNATLEVYYLIVLSWVCAIFLKIVWYVYNTLLFSLNECIL